MPFLRSVVPVEHDKRIKLHFFSSWIMRNSEIAPFLRWVLPVEQDKRRNVQISSSWILKRSEIALSSPRGLCGKKFRMRIGSKRGGNWILLLRETSARRTRDIRLKHQWYLEKKKKTGRYVPDPPIGSVVCGYCLKFTALPAGNVRDISGQQSPALKTCEKTRTGVWYPVRERNRAIELYCFQKSPWLFMR